MTVISDKHFKIFVLKEPKELKEDVEKIKKIMCKENENINEETENPKRNKT